MEDLVLLEGASPIKDLQNREIVSTAQAMRDLKMEARDVAEMYA
jgi:hypothetical protein